jgi:hypothetical protein
LIVPKTILDTLNNRGFDFNSVYSVIRTYKWSNIHNEDSLVTEPKKITGVGLEYAEDRLFEKEQECMIDGLNFSIEEFNKDMERFSKVYELYEDIDNNGVTSYNLESIDKLYLDTFKTNNPRQNITSLNYGLESLSEVVKAVFTALSKHYMAIIVVLFGVFISLLGYLLKKKLSDNSSKLEKEIKATEKEIEIIKKRVIDSEKHVTEEDLTAKSLHINSEVMDNNLLSFKNTFNTKLDLMILNRDLGYTSEDMLKTIIAHRYVSNNILESIDALLSQYKVIVNKKVTLLAIIHAAIAIKHEFLKDDLILIELTREPLYKLIAAAGGKYPHASTDLTAITPPCKLSEISNHLEDFWNYEAEYKNNNVTRKSNREHPYSVFKKDILTHPIDDIVEKATKIGDDKSSEYDSELRIVMNNKIKASNQNNAFKLIIKNINDTANYKINDPDGDNIGWPNPLDRKFIPHEDKDTYISYNELVRNLCRTKILNRKITAMNELVLSLQDIGVCAVRLSKIKSGLSVYLQHKQEYLSRVKHELDKKLQK